MQNASSARVRFPDHTWAGAPADGQHVIYHLCSLLPGVDPEEAVAHVYVGVTSHFAQRMRQHARKWWWPLVRYDVSEFDVRDTRAEANAVEADLIRWYQPAINRAGRLLVVTG